MKFKSYAVTVELSNGEVYMIEQEGKNPDDILHYLIGWHNQRYEEMRIRKIISIIEWHPREVK